MENLSLDNDGIKTETEYLQSIINSLQTKVSTSCSAVTP